jgi:mono/diheme cytochrome c family protein
LEAKTRPLGPSSVMPPFGKLLSEDERNAIAEYVGSLPK